MRVNTMTTSGLVVTFDPNYLDRQSIADRIRQAGPFTVGEAVGHRLTVALEAPTARDAEQWCKWLRQLPGIVMVLVASVEYGVPEEETDVNP